MAKKTIGYVELEWVCPNCRTKNPGSQKTCISCGSPQPEDVQFQKAAQDKLLTNEEEITKAKAGADIHCPYCGTRNAMGTKICNQCGGDLVGGKARESGQTLGAFQDKPVTIKCPNCHAENDSTNIHCEKCGSQLSAEYAPPAQQKIEKDISPTTTKSRKFNPLFLLLPLAGLLILCIIIVILVTQKTEKPATVVDVYWERSISIEEFGLVTKSGWVDEIPSQAQIGDCTSEYHHTSDQPEVSSTEVCGEPYVVDDGSGYGEVVQDCEYMVYMDRCSYSVEEWFFVETISAQGTDLYASWPVTNLVNDQRESSRQEQYRVSFDDGDSILTYVTQDYAEFEQFTPGSEWLLTVNGLNAITDVLPAN